MSEASRLPEWARSLDLQPHPEGGWYRETWRSGVEIPCEALLFGYEGTRVAATAIYFVLLPGEQSSWHTVRGAEMWLFHRGAPVELDLGGEGEEPNDVETGSSAPTWARGSVRKPLSRLGIGNARVQSATRRRSSVASSRGGSTSRFSRSSTRAVKRGSRRGRRVDGVALAVGHALGDLADADRVPARGRSWVLVVASKPASCEVGESLVERIVVGCL